MAEALCTGACTVDEGEHCLLMSESTPAPGGEESQQHVDVRRSQPDAENANAGMGGVAAAPTPASGAGGKPQRVPLCGPVHPIDFASAQLVFAACSTTFPHPLHLVTAVLGIEDADFAEFLQNVAEAGCSGVDLLAAYLTNLRVMEEDALAAAEVEAAAAAAEAGESDAVSSDVGSSAATDPAHGRVVMPVSPSQIPARYAATLDSVASKARDLLSELALARATVKPKKAPRSSKGTQQRNKVAMSTDAWDCDDDPTVDGVWTCGADTGPKSASSNAVSSSAPHSSSHNTEATLVETLQGPATSAAIYAHRSPAVEAAGSELDASVNGLPHQYMVQSSEQQSDDGGSCGSLFSSTSTAVSFGSQTHTHSNTSQTGGGLQRCGSSCTFEEEEARLLMAWTGGIVEQANMSSGGRRGPRRADSLPAVAPTIGHGGGSSSSPQSPARAKPGGNGMQVQQQQQSVLQSPPRDGQQQQQQPNNRNARNGSSKRPSQLSYESSTGNGGNSSGGPAAAAASGGAAGVPNGTGGGGGRGASNASATAAATQALRPQGSASRNSSHNGSVGSTGAGGPNNGGGGRHGQQQPGSQKHGRLGQSRAGASHQQAMGMANINPAAAVSAALMDSPRAPSSSNVPTHPLQSFLGLSQAAAAAAAAQQQAALQRHLNLNHQAQTQALAAAAAVARHHQQQAGLDMSSVSDATAVSMQRLLTQQYVLELEQQQQQAQAQQMFAGAAAGLLPHLLQLNQLQGMGTLGLHGQPSPPPAEALAAAHGLQEQASAAQLKMLRQQPADLSSYLHPASAAGPWSGAAGGPGSGGLGGLGGLGAGDMMGGVAASCGMESGAHHAWGGGGAAGAVDTSPIPMDSAEYARMRMMFMQPSHY